MPRLPLNTLSAFRTVAELQNLRAAAEVLHLTHSAVSQQIRGLEEQLGFDLFERRGRRVLLNPAGQALLRSVQNALDELDDGMQAAAAAASGAAERLRVTMLPSFAHVGCCRAWGAGRNAIRARTRDRRVASSRRSAARWLSRCDSPRRGPWAGLESERLFDQPMPFIVVGSPAAARRLLGAQPQALTREPLLGDVELWAHWFAAAGIKTEVRPVAVFNDAGLMLQAAEQNLGLALGRELLAADALTDGRLVKLSPLAITYDVAQPYHLVYPPNLRDWPPLVALRKWLFEELELSRRALHPTATRQAKAKHR
jgi:LysR family glycine cleavage system transcriptional activator